MERGPPDPRARRQGVGSSCSHQGPRHRANRRVSTCARPEPRSSPAFGFNTASSQKPSGTRAGSGTSLLAGPSPGPWARARRLRWWRGDRTGGAEPEGEGTGGGEGRGKGRGENRGAGPQGRARLRDAEETPGERGWGRGGGLRSGGKGGGGAGRTAGRGWGAPEGRGPAGSGAALASLSDAPRPGRRRGPLAPAGRRVPGAAELAPLPVSLLQARAARGDTQAGRGDVGPRRVGIRVPLPPGLRSSAKK